MIPGFATAEGTARYCEGFSALSSAGHFRRPEHVPGAGELWLSSVGIGTYLGEPDAATDASYTEAIVEAVLSGVNVIDTAINYRHQRSERNIGAALRQLISGEVVRRDELLVCTKAGYLSLDGEVPPDPRGYFMREYLERGVMQGRDVVGGMHCMAPSYLGDQMERSRRNLGLETIDVFYVHNPETQLSQVARPAFRDRLKAAFEMLEKAVEEGQTRFYGMATWSGFLAPPTDKGYLSLTDALLVAKEVAGPEHHFRFLQLPFNLAMPEAYAAQTQMAGVRGASVFELAHRSGMAVMGSATLYQGRLTGNLPPYIGEVLGMEGDAQNAIQFSRSAPGLTTALIGMRKKEHVRANLEVAVHPLTPEEEWKSLFSRAR